MYGNGEKIGDSVSLHEDNGWTTTWDNLPEKESGKTIVYTVKESGIPSGYKVSVDDSNIGNIRITNSHTTKKITISNETGNGKKVAGGYPLTGELINESYLLLGISLIIAIAYLRIKIVNK